MQKAASHNVHSNHVECVCLLNKQ